MFVLGRGDYDKNYKRWLFQSTSLQSHGLFHEFITIIITRRFSRTQNGH
jgi:hypothetical protein